MIGETSSDEYVPQGRTSRRWNTEERCVFLLLCKWHGVSYPRFLTWWSQIHGSSDRSVRDSPSPARERKVGGGKNNSSPTRTRRHFWTAKWGLGSFCSNIERLHKSRPDMAVINEEDNMMNQVLTGAVQEAGHFTCICSLFNSSTCVRMLVCGPILSHCTELPRREIFLLWLAAVQGLIGGDGIYGLLFIINEHTFIKESSPPVFSLRLLLFSSEVNKMTADILNWFLTLGFS